MREKSFEMSLSTELNEQIKSAMRAKDKDRLTLLRSVKAAIKNRELELRRELEPAEEVAILMKLVKMRREAAAGFRQGGAEDRAKNEDREAEALEMFLPAAPSEEEVASAIEAELSALPPEDRTPKAMGQIMKAIQAKFAGRPLDGKAISAQIKGKLSL